MATTTGGYVRHRDRMVQESVLEDLRDTLIACRWMPGTTSGPVWDPYAPAAGYVPVTTGADETLALLDEHPIVLLDYFPDDEIESGDEVGGGQQNKTALNTFALDNGTPGAALPRELGSSAQVVPYTFNLAFFASSDGVAQAVLNDLRDRYAGRLVRDSTIELWNFNSDSALPVVRMDVDSFIYRVNTEAATRTDVHLYFGELLIVDEVD